MEPPSRLEVRRKGGGGGRAPLAAARGGGGSGHGGRGASKGLPKNIIVDNMDVDLGHGLERIRERIRTRLAGGGERGAEAATAEGAWGRATVGASRQASGGISGGGGRGGSRLRGAELGGACSKEWLAGPTAGAARLSAAPRLPSATRPSERSSCGGTAPTQVAAAFPLDDELRACSDMFEDIISRDRQFGPELRRVKMVYDRKLQQAATSAPLAQPVRSSMTPPPSRSASSSGQRPGSVAGGGVIPRAEAPAEGDRRMRVLSRSPELRQPVSEEGPEAVGSLLEVEFENCELRLLAERLTAQLEAVEQRVGDCHRAAVDAAAAATSASTSGDAATAVSVPLAPAQRPLSSLAATSAIATPAANASAEAGSAFCNGGPQLSPRLLRRVFAPPQPVAPVMLGSGGGSEHQAVSGGPYSHTASHITHACVRGASTTANGPADADVVGRRIGGGLATGTFCALLREPVDPAALPPPSVAPSSVGGSRASSAPCPPASASSAVYASFPSSPPQASVRPASVSSANGSPPRGRTAPGVFSTASSPLSAGTATTAAPPGLVRAASAGRLGSLGPAPWPWPARPAGSIAWSDLTVEDAASVVVGGGHAGAATSSPVVAAVAPYSSSGGRGRLADAAAMAAVRAGLNFQALIDSPRSPIPGATPRTLSGSASVDDCEDGAARVVEEDQRLEEECAGCGPGGSAGQGGGGGCGAAGSSEIALHLNAELPDSDDDLGGSSPSEGEPLEALPAQGPMTSFSRLDDSLDGLGTTACSADSGVLPQRPERVQVTRPNAVPPLDLTGLAGSCLGESDDEAGAAELDEAYSSDPARSASPAQTLECGTGDVRSPEARSDSPAPSMECAKSDGSPRAPGMPTHCNSSTASTRAASTPSL